MSSTSPVTPVRVLYIHLSGQYGGAPKSLLELIRAFPPEAVECAVLLPRGPVHQMFVAAGIRCIGCWGLSLFDNTRYSHYRGFRWLVLLRELCRIPSTFLGVMRARREFPHPDVIHANEVLLLLPIMLAARLFRRPIVVHVRAVQRTAADWRRRLVTAVLRRHAARIVPIDETVRRSLPSELRTDVIHNGLVPLTIRRTEDTSLERRPLAVAMIGNVNLAKGCREFVEAALLTRAQNLPIRYLLVGARVHAGSGGVQASVLRLLGLRQDIEADLRDFVRRSGLHDTVEFRAFDADLRAVYEGVDVVCFPSHLDAPGRPVFEAAFFGIPSILAVSAPTADTFVDGETGIRIAAGSPDELATAIRFLYEHPADRARMGSNARALAERNFDARRNSLTMLDLYRQVRRASVDTVGGSERESGRT